MIAALKDRFKSTYSPHCQFSVDEAMIPFKDRSSMKQCLPLKLVKRSLGREREMALGEKVVLTLSDFVKGKHHQLLFDNYLTSLPHLDKLHAQLKKLILVALSGPIGRTSRLTSARRQKRSSVASRHSVSLVTSAQLHERTTKWLM